MLYVSWNYQHFCICSMLENLMRTFLEFFCNFPQFQRFTYIWLVFGILFFKMYVNLVPFHKINLDKSFSSLFNAFQDMVLQPIFHISERDFKYLGIFISSDLFSSYYSSLVMKIKNDLLKRSLLSTSLLSRVNTI